MFIITQELQIRNMIKWVRNPTPSVRSKIGGLDDVDPWFGENCSYLVLRAHNILKQLTKSPICIKFLTLPCLIMLNVDIWECKPFLIQSQLVWMESSECPLSLKHVALTLCERTPNHRFGTSIDSKSSILKTRVALIPRMHWLEYTLPMTTKPSEPRPNSCCQNTLLPSLWHGGMGCPLGWSSLAEFQLCPRSGTMFQSPRSHPCQDRHHRFPEISNLKNHLIFTASN